MRDVSLRLGLLFFVLALPVGASARDALRVDGARLGAAGALGAPDLRVETASGAGAQPLLVIERPPVTARSFGLTGTVTTGDVAPPGYLEMWSVFPDGSRYFTRTLDVTGPLAALSGSSGARAFALPFFLEPKGPTPERLEVGVVLPGAGWVEIRDLRFVSPFVPPRAAGAWWSSREGGIVGGTLGCLFGIAGAGVGLLAGLGRARRVVETLLRGMLVVGLASLAAAAVALFLAQPYEVWYPLSLLGVVGTAVSAVVGTRVRRGYEARAAS